jgi:curved DNA-binding protein CbpA
MDPSNIEKYDCYSILGITHNADDDEIKRAYRRLALQYHPDRNKSTEAAAIFTVVQIAYDTLTDSGKDAVMMQRSQHLEARSKRLSKFYSRAPIQKAMSWMTMPL